MVKHKHKWKLIEGDMDSVILYCECGQIRSCFDDGYKDWDNSQGVYKIKGAKE